MIKLLLFVLCVFVMAAATLQLRQQELQLRHRAANLQQKIQGMQARLWEQQVMIARETAPNALTQTLGGHDLSLRPAGKLPDKAANWINAAPPEPH